MEQETVATEGLLLPVTTLALLGGGPEGASAIAQYGVASADFDAAFDALQQRLALSDDAEASAQLDVSRYAATVGRTATGWISVIARGVEPALVLVCPNELVAVRILGQLTEWLPLGADELHPFVEATIARAAGGDVLVTGFRQGDALAGIRIDNGEAELATRDAARLYRLSKESGGGLPGLCRGLLAELR